MTPDPAWRPRPEDRELRFLDHLRLNVYWFGFNLVWGAILSGFLTEQIKVLAPDHPAGKLGMIFFWAAFPPLIVPLVAGPMSDRCTSRYGRRRPFIAVGSLVGVLGMFAMSAVFTAHVALGAEAFALYVAGYFVLQFGMNVALAAYMGVIPDMVPVGQRGLASGYYAVLSQLGTLAGVLCAVKLKGTVLDVLAMCFAAIALLTLVTLREPAMPKSAAPKTDWGAQLRSLWIDPRRHPDFAWVWLTRALMMLGFYSILPMLNLFMHDVAGSQRPLADSAKMTGLVLIVATLAGFIGGVVSDRVGRKRIVVWSSMIMAFAALAFTMLHALGQVLGAAIVFGFGFGAYTSVDWALGADVLPDKSEAAKDMSVWHIAMVLPQQIGPLLALTVILEQFAGPKEVVDGVLTRTYGLGGYVTVFLFASALFFVSGLLVRKVKGST